MKAIGRKLGVIYLIANYAVFTGCEAQVSLPGEDRTVCKNTVSSHGIFKGDVIQIRTYDKFGKLVPFEELKIVSNSLFFKKLNSVINVEFIDEQQPVDTSTLSINVVNFAYKQGGSKSSGSEDSGVINYEYPWFSDSFDLDAINYPTDLITRYKKKSCMQRTCVTLSPNNGEISNNNFVAGFLVYEHEKLRGSYCFFTKLEPLPNSYAQDVSPEMAADMAKYRKREYLWKYAECVGRSMGLNGRYNLTAEQAPKTIFSFDQPESTPYIEQFVLDDKTVTNTLQCITSIRKMGEEHR